ncbi:hypothetical protein [Salinivibrio sp. IB872]|uniref:hypothetical protein n=1 Tax=Salinivibrio sp. IB872 TaxID=1766123 RepID=UPI0018E3280B|nr:hypothetical protein [Salinivibrio sp. IB872]
MEMTQYLIISGLTGVASSVATVVALKVDIRWIKSIVQDHENRIRLIEGISNGQ